MTKYTPIPAAGLLLILCAAVSAVADNAVMQTPAGEWLVKDKTAHIRIVACDANLWGIISWAKDPDTDKHNPDPARRNQPVLGLPVLLAMHASGDNQWDGHIYDAQNGKTYAGAIRLQSADVLHIQGCTLYGIVCGGENWMRLKAAPDEETAGSLCRRIKGIYPDLF